MWTIPFGFPVLPDVYSMNNMSSLSKGSGGQLVDSLAMAYMYVKMYIHTFNPGPCTIISLPGPPISACNVENWDRPGDEATTI